MSSGEIWSIVSCLSPITLIVGLIVGLLYFRYISKGYSVLVVYLAVSFIMDLLFRYFGYISHLRYNLFLIPIFGFFELAVFSVLYYKYIYLKVKVSLF